MLLKSSLCAFVLLFFISFSSSHAPGDSHKYAEFAEVSYDIVQAARLKQDGNIVTIPGNVTNDGNGGYDSNSPGKSVLFNSSSCGQFPPSLFTEIQSYAPIIDQIIAAATSGAYKGLTYNNLSYFVDTYDRRLSGSDELESAIDYLQDQMKTLGFSNVKTEPVPNMPAWRRGSETAQMLAPKKKEIAILGLGSTASTPATGITAQAIVFDSYEQLIANQSNVRDKIVVCNFAGPPSNVLHTVNNGYVEAVTSGALVMLYKSATTLSLYSPHARRANLYYVPGVKNIPIAYITVEDTNLLSRISGRGQTITLHVNMQNVNATRTSRNLFGDLTGSKKPDEFLLLSAHTDNWDVGQGALDDGFGLFLAMQGTSLLKSLGLTPRRTIRTAFWTSEEYGYLGSEQYVKEHRSEFSKLQIAMEADYGCLESVGLIFNGRYELGCILNEILALVTSNAARPSLGVLAQANVFRTDLDHFEDAVVPVLSLYGDDGRYFYFHHTHADTMTALESQTLDRCLATWTAAAYILADLTNGVPQGFDIY